MKTRVLLTAAALALAAVAGNAQQTVSDGLGTVHFPISCTAVQAKFERAVALLHNFHYPETATQAEYFAIRHRRHWVPFT